MHVIKSSDLVRVNRSKWWHHPKDNALTLCNYVHQGIVKNSILRASKPICPRCQTIKRRENKK